MSDIRMELEEYAMPYLCVNAVLVHRRVNRRQRILHIAAPHSPFEEPIVWLLHLEPEYDLEPYAIALQALRNAVASGVWTQQRAQEPPLVPLSDTLSRPGQPNGPAALGRWRALKTKLPEGVCLLNDARLLMRCGRAALLAHYASHLQVSRGTTQALVRWAWRVGATRYAAGCMPAPYPTARNSAEPFSAVSADLHN